MSAIFLSFRDLTYFDLIKTCTWDIDYHVEREQDQKLVPGAELEEQDLGPITAYHAQAKGGCANEHVGYLTGRCFFCENSFMHD